MINEGLIAVPQNMLQDAMHVVLTNVLWWARDQLKDRDESFSGHKADLRKWAKALDYKIPRARYPDEMVRVEGFAIDLSDIPGRYGENEEKGWYVAVDWRPGRTGAAWRPDKRVLIVYPMSQRELARYPSRHYPDFLSEYFEQVEHLIEHELRHAVQYLLLAKRDPKQIKRLPGYSERDKSHDAYFGSPVEFDPTIGSAAREFMQLIDMARKGSRKIDLNRWVKRYVGLTPDITMSDEFFKSLKRTNPAKYRLAVKKFIQEVHRLMAASPQ